MMLFTMTTVSFYMITAYTPTFGSQVLHFSSKEAFIVTFCVGTSNLFWLPVIGSLSDRVGRMPILVACTSLMVLTSYPAMLWLTGEPSLTRLLVVELWFSFVYASFNGALIVYVTELIPIGIRTVGFSLAYSLATAVFGGFTPAISTYLIHASKNRAAPGFWLAFAAMCGLIAALIAHKRKNISEDVSAI
jgi:MHS family citrate/tricarballylate:H+ symporter-like MFS transporter